MHEKCEQRANGLTYVAFIAFWTHDKAFIAYCQVSILPHHTLCVEWRAKISWQRARASEREIQLFVEVTLQAPQIDKKELMKMTAVSYVIMKKLSKILSSDKIRAQKKKKINVPTRERYVNFTIR